MVIIFFIIISIDKLNDSFKFTFEFLMPNFTKIIFKRSFTEKNRYLTM